jgi:hypothetical protein
MSSLSPEAYAFIEGRHSAPSGISAPTSKATYPSSVFSFRMRKASQSSMNKATYADSCCR